MRHSALAANEEGTQHLFEFDNCSYTVGSGDKAKTLLSGISGSVKGGHILTIMGPSGAGKSVLMKLLTLEKGPGQPTGTIKLNGQAFTQKVYRESCAYVSQIDRHCAFLTTREHLEVSVALYRSELSAAEQAAVVDDLLKQMGLESCQHTRAGNEFIRGLSGGQARRLSLAIALSKKPALIFLDEPTSGLDAAAAASIMTFLKKSAATNGTAILCTIHQPSVKVFEGFDDTLILSSGCTAYFGAASELNGYLERIGHPVPAGSNPPEHMLDLVNKDFSSPEAVSAVLERYRFQPATPPNAVSSLPQPSQAPFALQTWLLLKKLCKLTYKDPILYVGRVATFLLTCSFFAIIYIKARDLAQDQILSRLFLIMWLVGVPSAFGTVATFALNVDAKAIKREVRDGMYSPVAYVLSHTLLQLPMMLLLALAAVGVPAYGIAAFNASAFGQFVLVYACFL